MKKNKKIKQAKVNTENLSPSEEELMKDNDNLDILDIDDEDDPTISLHDNFDDDIDSESDGDTINSENTIEDKIQSDINVLICPNCKEAVLESDICSICGKPLRKAHLSDNEDNEEDEVIMDVDPFNDENYLKDEIESSIDTNLIDL